MEIGSGQANNEFYFWLRCDFFQKSSSFLRNKNLTSIQATLNMSYLFGAVKSTYNLVELIILKKTSYPSGILKKNTF